MKNRKPMALLLAALLALAVLAGGCSAPKGEGAFTAKTLDGGTFTPEDLAAKDLTAINFWGTYCAPCIQEMPDLAAFEKALPDNVQMITVCVDAQFNEATAGALLEQAGYEGITLVSGDEAFDGLLEGVQAVPTTLFLDSTGKQVGTPIIGGGFQDFSGTFLQAMNQALTASGKAEISLEE